MPVYRIRRKKDGKFSSGGPYPVFTLKGMAWTDLDELKAAVAKTRSLRYEWKGDPDFYAECEIVEYEMTGKVTDIE